MGKRQKTQCKCLTCLTGDRERKERENNTKTLMAENFPELFKTPIRNSRSSLNPKHNPPKGLHRHTVAETH